MIDQTLSPSHLRDAHFCKLSIYHTQTLLLTCIPIFTIAILFYLWILSCSEPEKLQFHHIALLIFVYIIIYIAKYWLNQEDTQEISLYDHHWAIIIIAIVIIVFKFNLCSCLSVSLWYPLRYFESIVWPIKHIYTQA